VTRAGWAVSAIICGAVGGRLVFGFAGRDVNGLDVVIFACVAALLVLARRRRSRPAPPVPAEGPDPIAAPAVEAREERPAADGDLARGVRDVRRTDPGFDPTRFAGYAAMVFRDAQRAWTTGDLDTLRERVTPELHAELQARYDRGRGTRGASRVDEIEIAAEVTEAWQEGGRDYLTAHIAGSIVDDASGSRARAISRPVDEFWTFTRRAGLNFWMLSAIQTA